MEQSRGDVKSSDKSEGWFATFTILDFSGAIGSSVVRRLIATISKMWRLMVRSASDGSKARLVGV
jgi:hypothetical protein